MDKKSLQEFLVAGNKAGYATGNENDWVKQADGSTTISFEQGDFLMHDNFFGGEPYGGRMVVFYQKKAVWMMVYYGFVFEGVDTAPVYAMLRKALSQMPASCPLRGPHSISDKDLEYTNYWEGDILKFMGEEQIIRNDEGVYKATYAGGLIDV